MVNKSLNKKVAVIIIIGMLVIVLFSIIVSYLFYSNALMSGMYANHEEYKKEFFIIFSLAELLVAFLITVIILTFFNINIIKPIKSLNEAFEPIVDAENSDRRDLKELSQKELNSKIKKININSGDEIELLYQNISKMQMSVNEFIGHIQDDNWEVEHDSMTMLGNSKKFEKRCIEVYPYVNSIYIACLDVINMSVVNTKLSTEAGDSIIGKVGRELRRISSDSIHTYRLHDDIFLVVMCGYKEDEAITVLNRWNGRVGRLNRITDSFECRVVWGGSYGENNFNVTEVYKRADAEMYCNKMIVKNELVTI